MQTVRALFAALLAVVVPRMARAADPEPPPPPRIGIEMNYTRNPGTEKNCAPRETMELLLLGEYHYDPFDLSREEVHIVVEVTLSRKNGQYHGAYTIARAGEEPLWVQEMDDRQCMEVLKDIANAIPIYTNDLFPAPEPAPPPPPAPPAPSLPPPAPPAALPRRPPRDKPKPPQRPEPPLSPLVVSVEPSLAFGLVPGVGLGGAVTFAYKREPYSLGLSASWFTTPGQEIAASHYIRGSSTEGTAVPCRTVTGADWPISLSLCATLGFGVRTLSALPTVTGVAPVASPHYFALSMGGRVQIEKALTRRIIVGGFGGLGTPVWSHAVSPLPPDGYAEGRKPPDGYGTLVQFNAVGALGLYVGAHM